MSASSCTLPIYPAAIGLKLPVDRGGDALGDGHAPEDTPDMARRYTLLPGNLAEIRPEPKLLPESCDVRGRLLEGQTDASLTNEAYSIMESEVKKIIPKATHAAEPASIAESVCELRDAIGYSQKQLGDAVGVSQSNVAKWEAGKLKPPGALCVRLSKLASVEKKAYWLGLAGVVYEEPSEETSVRWVPLLRDPAACGTPRAIDDTEVEEMLAFPRRWLPHGGSILAIKVTGDSMSPLLEEGYIALVDISSHEAGKLVDRMVLARDGDEVTLKWLRKQESMFLLVPQNTSVRHPIRVWTRSDSRAIVGEIVGFFGTPPRQRGKRK